MRGISRAVLTLGLLLFVVCGRAAAPNPLDLKSVVALAYTPDGRMLAAGYSFRNLVILRTADGTPLASFAPRAVTSPILALRFMSDGKRLAVATQAGLHLFDVTSGAELKQIPLAASAAAFSADGHLLAFPAGGNVEVLDIDKGERVATLATDLGFRQTLAFSPDGRFVAVGAQEAMLTLGGPQPRGVPSKNLELFELASGHRRIFAALSPWFSAIGFSADSLEIAAITFDHTPGRPMNDFRDTIVNVWRIDNGDVVLQEALPDDTSLYSHLFFLGGSGTIVATAGASWGGDLAIVDVATGKITHAGPFDIPAIFAAALVPSAKAIAIGGMFRGVQLRELPSRRLMTTLGAPAPK